MVCVGRVDSLRFYFPVHCRIGSLETDNIKTVWPHRVHCRIGSLEIYLMEGKDFVDGSLPHRQFRNMPARRR